MTDAVQNSLPSPALDHRRRSRRSTKLRVRGAVTTLLTHLVLLAGGLIMLLPVLWTLSSSFKLDGQITAWPPTVFPNPVTFDHYVAIWTAAPSWQYMKNSLIVSSISVTGAILSSTMAGFAFGRVRFPGRDKLFILCISTMMLPFVVTMIPSFILYRILGLIDTFVPLTLGSWLGPAFDAFLSRQFMRTLPMELDEAARIDGAATWRIWWSIMLPNSSALVVSIGILAFTSSWDAFIGPLIYINSQKNYTLALGLRTFHGYYRTLWGMLMAGSMIMMAPMIVLFFSMQRYFLRGIAFSGLAGR